MVGWSKTLLLLVLAAMLLVAAAPTGAQEKAKEGQKEPPYSKPYPMGQVVIKLTGIGAGVGMEWGNGVLTYKGKQYTFKVKGIQVGTVGIKTATATGEVYNLFSLGEFAGQYVAGSAGVAVFKGKEGKAFTNTKGVHILLDAEQKGMSLKIGPDGFMVRMDQAL